jgi:hypothetical protein
LQSCGVLDFARYELVEGDLIDRTGQIPPHVHSVTAIVIWLQQVFGGKFVRFTGPTDVSPEDNPTNEPEPDALVLTREYSLFSEAPRPEDLHLVVEVSDSTLEFDLTGFAQPVRWDRRFRRSSFVEPTGKTACPTLPRAPLFRELVTAARDSPKGGLRTLGPGFCPAWSVQDRYSSNMSEIQSRSTPGGSPAPQANQRSSAHEA